jgi:BolA-like protein 1
VIVSEQFVSTKNLMERHRMIHTALKEQLEGPVHALSIVAKTPLQWEAMQSDSKDGIVRIHPSPDCRGGDGSLPKKGTWNKQPRTNDEFRDKNLFP